MPEQVEDRKKQETIESTIAKVVSILREIGATIDENDISIAHQLPSRLSRGKLIIDSFARRVGKIGILR